MGMYLKNIVSFKILINNNIIYFNSIITSYTYFEYILILFGKNEELN